MTQHEITQLVCRVRDVASSVLGLGSGLSGLPAALIMSLMPACLERAKARAGAGWEVQGKGSKDEPSCVRASGLIQPTSGLHHFKASFLECPQRLNSIYFPADFTVTKVVPNFTYFPTGPWRCSRKVLFPRGEDSEQCDCHWLTSHLLFILSPLGASNQPLKHVSVRFPQRMGWPYSELSPVTGTTKTPSPNLSAGAGNRASPILCFQTCSFRWQLL